MVDLTKENFEEEVLKAEGTVLVDFYGDRNKGPVGQGASGAHRRGEGAAFETQVAARSFADREPVYNQKIPQRHRAHADNSASEKP